MDFVPNHSSDLHVWFNKSIAREGQYDNYYVWKDAKGRDEEGKPIPPNNWVKNIKILNEIIRSEFITFNFLNKYMHR